MHHPPLVAVLVGSLREGSYSRMVACTLANLGSPALDLEIVGTGDLPLYDEDLEVDPPRAWVDFRRCIREADGVLFVTPEYNRSVPGALKNALDVASRPQGQNAWAGKPGAIVSVSPGAIGGFGANHHLRQSLVFLDVPTMQQPEAYVGGVKQLFNDRGDLSSDATRDFLAGFMQSFTRWVEQHARTPALAP